MTNVRQKLSGILKEVAKSHKTGDLETTARIDLAANIASVSPCQDSRFGDYQSSIALVLAKIKNSNSRELAAQLAEQIKATPEIKNLCENVDVAGPGFINFRLTPTFVAQQLTSIATDREHLGIAQVPQKATIVIDFSSPNIAKAMHVGHIRSTFLGDALSRVIKEAGYHVITVNHLGDWGTQFGKLIYGYKKFLNPQSLSESPIAEFERLYKEAHELAEKDPQILQAVRQELAKLQSGDPENLRIWQEISKQSLQEFHGAYERMGVAFDYELGESFYHSQLSKVVEELKRLGIARESEGAICIFFDEPGDDPELKNVAPMMIQKADGSYLYATTDLAAVQYRVEKWETDRILYITDARQQLHFKQLCRAIDKWISKKNELKEFDTWKKDSKGECLFPPTITHITFGSILGSDRKPIKTRSGESIKLKELLDEAVSRASKIIQEKNPDLSESEHQKAAQVIGIGALKYADLCQNRNLDYIFDWNKLLAFQGNTAPYLIYAYVRIRSIFRSVTEKDKSQAPTTLQLSTPEELSLGKHLIQFSDTVHAVLEDYRPHLLTNYLYELAVKFSKFYETCPILKAEESLRSQRLALADLTARTLKKGLELLGIETLERM